MNITTTESCSNILNALKQRLQGFGKIGNQRYPLDHFFRKEAELVSWCACCSCASLTCDTVHLQKPTHNAKGFCVYGFSLGLSV